MPAASESPTPHLQDRTPNTVPPETRGLRLWLTGIRSAAAAATLRRRIASLVALLAVSVLFAPALASAATVSYDAGLATATLVDGPADNLSLSISIVPGGCSADPNAKCDAFSAFNVQSTNSQMVAGPGCLPTASPYEVRCPDAVNYAIHLADGDNYFRVYPSSFCWGSMTVDSGAGADYIELNPSPCPGLDDAETIDAGPGPDKIFGGPGPGVLHGGDGPDRIFGGTGNERIYGDGGDDGVLNGGPGDDVIDGGAGDDQLGDRLEAGQGTLDPGADSYTGGAGNDLVSYAMHSGVTVSLDGAANDGAAGEGDNVSADIETVSGSRDADTLIGNDGPNGLVGDFGNDILVGNGGDDALDGGFGTDRTDGGAGQDTLTGGPDDDTLNGGSGRDSIFGDSAICNFATGCPSGNDHVDAVDGEQDQVQCGPGSDVVNADSVDVTATDPINGCESVTRPSAAQQRPQVLKSLKAQRTTMRAALRSGVRVTLACQQTCRAKVRLTVSAATKRKYRLATTTIGSATGSRTGKGALVMRVKVAHADQRRLRHAHKVRLTITATPLAGAAGQPTIKTATTLK